MLTDTPPSGSWMFSAAGCAALFTMALLLVIALPATPASAQSGPSEYFDDVRSGTHAGAIDRIFEEGITEGCGSRRYCPDRLTTRAEMASFLARALDLPAPEGHHFDDIVGIAHHEDNINSLYEAGITYGCGSNRYCPERAVTRAETASFLVRSFDIPPTDTRYFDVGGVHHRDDINAISDAGLTNGCHQLGIAYCPNQALPRDQMATFLARATDLIPRTSIPMLLRPGDSSADVRHLQNHLRRMGYHVDDARGQYGYTTEHAVLAFQRVEGLTEDGIYGPETRWAMMHDPRQIMASFTTPLEPGESRNQNIHQALSYMHGDVISSGSTYALNAAIGPRTSARGFVANGYIDSDGNVISVVGGGVSQVATTFLNAAWFAGIDLVDFRQHTIYFERYPMCREATLAWDLLDVVVANDSPHTIEVSNTFTSTGATVTLVAPTWASVDSWIGSPYSIEGFGGAFSVDCGRTVHYPDGTSSGDSYSWRYDEGYPG